MNYGDNVMHHFIDPEYEDLTIQINQEKQVNISMVPCKCHVGPATLQKGS